MTRGLPGDTAGKYFLAIFPDLQISSCLLISSYMVAFTTHFFACYNSVMFGFTDGAGSIELQPKYPRSIETHEDHGSISSSDDFDELTYADGLPHHLPHGYMSNSVEVSKWRLKRKRNNRNVGKKYPDRTDAELPKGYANSRNSNWSSGGGFKADPIDKSLRNHASGYGSTGLHSSHETADLDGFAWNNQSITRGYWEDSQEYVDPFFVGRHPFGGRAMLIDVDLEVQANNYRRDVPMISLMSKLNGHAIIGHPIQIEALESDLSENHVSTTDYFHPEPLETPALPSAWRTGRRTANSRVPRPFLNGESKQHSLFINQDKRNQWFRIKMIQSPRIPCKEMTKKFHNENSGAEMRYFLNDVTGKRTWKFPGRREE